MSLIDNLKELTVNTNSCGKDIYRVSDLDQLKRFLIIGTESGTYYINSNELLKTLD